MWKWVSRGVRETFERGRSFGRPGDVRVNKEAPNNTPPHLKIGPCFFKRKCDDLRAPGRTLDGRKEEEAKERPTALPDPFDSWIAAFTCSSALVLGWVLTQPYYHWRKWWCVGREAPPLWAVNKESWLQLLANVAVTQPISQHKFIHPSGPPISPQTVNNTLQDSTFGPKTPEQAFDEAAEHFWAVHNSLMGDIENRKGVDCISRKMNSEAVGYFKKASGRGHPPAAYNLGQCYEMGIGTKQDFKEAASWYKVAADRGHPTAMYNLGVFHAHGWGGLAQDPATAKKLFIAAAEKGQPEAQAALDLPPTTKAKQPPSPQTLRVEDLLAGVDHQVDISRDPNHLYNLARTYEETIGHDTSNPQMILDLYKSASELGHAGAKSRLQVLLAFDAIGLLSEFLSSKKGAALGSSLPPSPSLTT